MVRGYQSFGWIFASVFRVEVLGYGLGDPGFESPERKEIYYSPELSDRLWGLPRLLFSMYQVYFSGVKHPELKADYSPASIAEVENGWSCGQIYIHLPSICCLVPLLV